MRVTALKLALCLLALGGLLPQAAVAGDILAIGDSVLAYYKREGASVPDAVSATLGRRVVNQAQSGATMGGGLLRSISGFKIPDQYDAKGWDWVIVDGGANDLRNDCDCGQCTAVLDGLISRDGRSGQLPDLVAQIRSDGPRVALMGYYEGPEREVTGFTDCTNELRALDARLANLAKTDPGIVFADAGDVIDPSDKNDYNADLVHPSPQGAAKIGRYLAEAIKAAESR